MSWDLIQFQVGERVYLAAEGSDQLGGFVTGITFRAQQCIEYLVRFSDCEERAFYDFELTTTRPEKEDGDEVFT